MPEVIQQSGAKDYDELLAASYRQLAKETDEQFDACLLTFRIIAQARATIAAASKCCRMFTEAGAVLCVARWR